MPKAAQKRPDAHVLVGDEPKQSISGDDFGLKTMVECLADVLTVQLAPQGYVLGIEGRWGSGKSTLVNFIVNEITKRDPKHRIVRFEPWLVSERSALLSFYFGLLAAEIDALKRKELPWWRLDRWRRRSFARGLAQKIRKYGEYVAILEAPVGTISAAEPTGTAAIIALVFKIFGRLSKILPANVPFDRLKAEITDELKSVHARQLMSRITVVIDNLDRLEPKEAIEILRLVRAVADFPITTYLLCFDRQILGEQVRTGLEITNGEEFIEKVFQSVISVPPQEPFALRRYLRKLLQTAFASEMSLNKPSDVDFEYRKHLLFDVWAGKLLTTPRDAVRVVDATKVGWPHIAAQADFFDFVWLQLIKLKAYELYQWIQGYLPNVGSYRDRGRAGDEERRGEALRLIPIVEKLGWREKLYPSGLPYFVPGLKSFDLKGDKRRVFDFSSDELSRFEAGRRLGSPTHWRRYFAFDLPTYAVRDEEIQELRQLLARNNVSSAAKIIMSLLDRPHEAPGHYLDVLLDRLLDEGNGPLSSAERKALLKIFAEHMDEIEIHMGGRKRTGDSLVWRRTLKILNRDVASNFLKLVGNGKSINWIAEVLRDQGSAHGIPQGRNVRPDDQWLNKPELDEAIKVFADRVRRTRPDEIFKKPSPLDILYCWSQLGDAAAARDYIARATQKDEKFLDALDAMRGWSSSSSNGIHHPLYRYVISSFMDADAANLRLQSLAARENSVPSEIRDRAQQLLKDWSDEQF